MDMCIERDRDRDRGRGRGRDRGRGRGRGRVRGKDRERGMTTMKIYEIILALYVMVMKILTRVSVFYFSIGCFMPSFQSAIPNLFFLTNFINADLY